MAAQHESLRLVVRDRSGKLLLDVGDQGSQTLARERGPDQCRLAV